MTVQNYYTKKELAEHIQNHYCYRIKPTSTLDLCAGSGNLSKPFYKGVDRGSIAFVEPDPQACQRLEKGFRGPHVKVFAMTAEEYCRTYAEESSFQTVFCNPPFGRRMGRTNLEELVRDLHLPEIEEFESYFLTLAAKLANTRMLFLLPESYFRKEEASRTFQSLAHTGWQLDNMAELPVDGYEGAVVKTYLCHFLKSSMLTDWPEALTRLDGDLEVPMFHRGLERQTFRGNFREITGYSMVGADKEKTTTLHFNHEPQFVPNPSMAIQWQPQPQPIGTHWNRMGCVYELTSSGWQPATGRGYLNGKPVSNGMDEARQAFEVMQRGAFAAASHLLAVEKIDIQDLASKHSDLPDASFLNLLPTPRLNAKALEDDLRALAILKLEPNLVKHFDASGLVSVGPYITRPASMQRHHQARLFVEGYLSPDAKQQFVLELNGHQIPLSQLELRSPWIPRSLIAQYLNVELDENSLYTDGCSYAQDRLLAYLNYGKAGERIAEGDQEYYDLANNHFALVMNHWEDQEFSNLRINLHAHYILREAGETRCQMDVSNLKPAFPLHAYQQNDLPFALSGQTILNWDVGLGKTFGGIAAAMAHPGKTLIVVPKPVISKWAREVQTFFPGTRVEALGFRRNTKNRLVLHMKGLVDQAKQCFFDQGLKIILTTHQIFARLQVNDRDQRNADIEDAYAMVGNSELRTHKKRREELIQSAAERNFLFGGELTFTDLPLAGLLVIIDEGHQFKSLFPMPSSGWGNQLVMAGNCGQSKRARDLKIKLDLVRKQGGKTLCLTATPVSNSVVEIFNMLRVYAPAVLEKRGILNPQMLIDTYCNMKTITTVSVGGTVVSGQTITGFRNVSDLQEMWNEAMVTRTAAEVGLPLPQVREHVIRIKPTPELAAFISEQKDKLGKHLETGNQTRKVSVFEVIAALDKVAMYPPMLDLNTNPKGERLVKNVAAIYAESRGGQIIFSDQLASQYGIKDMLVRAGVKAEHIAIINASTAPKIEDRLTIQDDFNSGKTKIVIGGDIAAEGIDLQKNSVAIHFNNLNWHGQAIHQRKGRAVRQGNTQPFVDIYYYLLEGTTDIYRMATTQNKTHWWEDLRSSQTDNIEGNVFSDPISDDLVASLANDPEAVLAQLRKIRKDEELQREIRTFQKTLKQMGIALNPEQRSASLPILQALEAKLMQLIWIDASKIREGIQRVQLIVALQAARFKNSKENPWEDLLDNKLGDFFNGPPYLTLGRITSLATNKAGELTWVIDFSECLKTLYHTDWAAQPGTFGKPRQAASKTVKVPCQRPSQAKIKVIHIQPSLPLASSPKQAPMGKQNLAVKHVQAPQQREVQLSLFGDNPNPSQDVA